MTKNQNKYVITLEDYNQIPCTDNLGQSEIFASGVVPDSPEWCHFANTGKLLRFVAIKRIDGWCVYVHQAHYTANYIRHFGDKLMSEANILACVNVSPELLKLYVY